MHNIQTCIGEDRYKLKNLRLIQTFFNNKVEVAFESFL
jgi:hypothetical protein